MTADIAIILSRYKPEVSAIYKSMSGHGYYSALVSEKQYVVIDSCSDALINMITILPGVSRDSLPFALSLSDRIFCFLPLLILVEHLDFIQVSLIHGYDWWAINLLFINLAILC